MQTDNYVFEIAWTHELKRKKDCLIHSDEEIEHVVFKTPASILVSLDYRYVCSANAFYSVYNMVRTFVILSVGYLASVLFKFFSFSDDNVIIIL